MKQSNENLNKGLISTIKKSELGQIVSDMTELAIDSAIKDGLFKDIPIINVITNFFKTGHSIREHLFIEKLVEFLKPISKYTPEQRRQYLEGLDDEELSKASKSIIIYLERLEAPDKAVMLGRVFEAYMLGEITYRAMLYFAHFIDAVFILVWEDFRTSIDDAFNQANSREFKPLYVSPNIHLDDALALEKAGFYQEKSESDYERDQHGDVKRLISIKRTLVVTDAGWEFIKVVFDYPEDGQSKFHRDCLDVEIASSSSF